MAATSRARVSTSALPATLCCCGSLVALSVTGQARRPSLTPEREESMTAESQDMAHRTLKQWSSISAAVAAQESARTPSSNRWRERQRWTLWHGSWLPCPPNCRNIKKIASELWDSQRSTLWRGSWLPCPLNSWRSGFSKTQ